MGSPDFELGLLANSQSERIEIWENAIKPLTQLFPILLDDEVLIYNYHTFCSGISFLQTVQTFVPLGYLALQFGQTIGLTKNVKAAACSGVFNGNTIPPAVELPYEGLKLLKIEIRLLSHELKRNLTPVASPIVAMCHPKRILSQNDAK